MDLNLLKLLNMKYHFSKLRHFIGMHTLNKFEFFFCNQEYNAWVDLKQELLECMEQEKNRTLSLYDKRCKKFLKFLTREEVNRLF